MAQPVRIENARIVETRTEQDLDGGIVTFLGNIEAVLIINTSGIDGVFHINGIPIPVPANSGLPPVGIAGKPGKIVEVDDATAFVIYRMG